MVDTVLAKHRVDPGKADGVREHFDSMAEDRELVECTLAVEETCTEAAFLDENDEAVPPWVRGTDTDPTCARMAVLT